MTTQLEAVFQGGVLRPLQPLNLLEDQKVVVTVATIPVTNEEEFLDKEFHRYCESRADYSITLEQVRKELSSIPGAIADEIIADREERF
ncbi:MAG: antitoxin family protein [Acidobacteria bacterium]|nr:antitoxin family protein [Acidobacteriota bacterium]